MSFEGGLYTDRETSGNASWQMSGGAQLNEGGLRRPGQKINVVSEEDYQRQAKQIELSRKWESIFKQEVQRRAAFIRHASVAEFQQCFKAEKGQEAAQNGFFDHCSREAGTVLAVHDLLTDPIQINIDPPMHMEKKDIVEKFGSLRGFVMQKIGLSLDEDLIEDALNDKYKGLDEILKNYLKKVSDRSKSEPSKTILATLMKESKIRDKVFGKMEGAAHALQPLVHETSQLRRQASQPHAVDEATHFQSVYEQRVKVMVPEMKRIIPEEKGKKMEGVSYEKFDHQMFSY